MPLRAILAYNAATMGFSDRDYQRGHYGDQPGFNMAGPQTMSTRLVIVMFAVYLLQLFTQPTDRPGSSWFTETFSLYPDVFVRPLYLFQLLTYGFLHDVNSLGHIFFNMLALWLFGRMVEERYGRREFLAFFLVAIVASGVVWVLGEFASNRGFAIAPAMLGASGGVTAVVILFALNYPHQTVLFMFVIPMPMWVLAVLIVVMDAFGAVQRSGNVAFTAHLGGAMFGFLYYQWGWRLERWLPSGNWRKRLRPKPKLRVVDPEETTDTDERVDRILKKIQDQGQESLTRRERRILERASQEYQKRRGGE
jgi:membrane associated rhomboid family serine protease